MKNRLKSVLCIIPVLLIYITPLSAQVPTSEVTVGSIAGNPVSYSELLQQARSGNDTKVTLEELQSFLPLYMDYKAKLLAARQQGIFQDSALLDEYKQYTTQAAYAFWLDNEVKTKAFEAFREKASYELKTFHILIALPENVNEPKINEALEELGQAKNEILNGNDLQEVNAKYSSERGGQSMGGFIPWISAGATVPAFENVIYNLEVGELSRPFRTQYGLHIALLLDKRKKTPSRLVKHIFVRAADDSSGIEKIERAHEALEADQDWNTVLSNFTDDKSSVSNDGRIGWVGYDGRLSPDFVDKVIEMDPSLPYSEPFQSSYGFHIVKIDSVESYASEKAKEAALMQEFENSAYYQENNNFVRDYLKAKYNAEINPESYTLYKNWLLNGTGTAIAEMQLPDSLSGKVLYQFNGKGKPLSDFHKFIKQKAGKTTGQNFRDNWISEFIDTLIDDEMIQLTMAEYPNFAIKARSYMDGLAVYKMNELNVWSTATVDTSRLRSIYESDRERYVYPERPYYYYLSAVEDSSLLAAKQYILDGGKPDSLDALFDDILVNMDSTNVLKQEPYDLLSTMEEESFSEIFEYNSLKGLFWLEDRLPARQMTFEEAFEQVHTVFQPQREKEWLEDLRTSYDVHMFPNKLREAYKQDSQ